MIPSPWLGMDPGGRGHRDNGDVANVRICMDAAGNHCRVYWDMPDLQFLEHEGANSGVQSNNIRFV